MRVFVCYTSRDPAITKESLKQVEGRIKPFATVFIDLLHNEAGNQRRVNRNLKRCDVVLQLISPGFKSEWVEKELIIARKKGKAVVKVGIEELLRMDQEQVYDLLSNVEKKGWSIWTILISALLICLALSFLGIWLSYRYVAGLPGAVQNGTLNNRGLFGDSWGGVNAIISAFAFAGVIVTLFLQNRDLNLQRREMARQREEFEKENETMKYQRFENLLYNMFDLQQKIVSGLRYTYDTKEEVKVPVGVSYVMDERRVEHLVLGRDLFRFAFEEMDVPIEMGIITSINGFRHFLEFEGCSQYGACWVPTYFDHYFRHFYRILKFINEQGFPFEEAYKYTSLFRGTLSRYELVWIYYNCLNEDNYKLKALVEKYSMLKNMRKELLARNKEYKEFLKSKGALEEALRESGFYLTDYDFYLSDSQNDPHKFYVGAFYNLDEISEGVDYIKRINAVLVGGDSKDEVSTKETDDSRSAM